MLPIKKNKFLLLFFLLFLNSFILLPEELDLALNYYNHAYHFYSVRNYRQAESLLNSALEFYPGLSDIYYLLARIYLSSEISVVRGLDSLATAVELDNWQYNSMLEAKKELAQLLFRTKVYPEAEVILLELVRNNQTDPGIEILLIQVFKAQDKMVLHDKYLVSALKKFPGVKELYILAVKNHLMQGRFDEAVKTLDMAESIFPGDQELFFYRIMLTDNTEKMVLVQQYLSSDDPRPEIILTGLRLDPEKSSHYLDLFMKHNGNYYLNLVRELWEIIGEQEEKAAYFQLLEQETIAGGTSYERVSDTNLDGFFEERYFFTSGGIEKLMIDNNQDGVNEFEVIFKNNQPFMCLELRGSDYIEYIYGQYPYLKSVKYPGKSSANLYQIIPFKVSFPILAVMNDYQYRIESSLDSLPESGAFSNAYKQEVIRPGTGHIEAVKEIHESAIIKEMIDTDADGIFDHFIEYKNNLPLEAVRDFDNNGTADAREYYREGRLQRIEFDENNDGNTDAVQTFSSPGTVLTYWDFNFDGKYDARQELKQDEVIYEFITGKDDIFDLKVKFKDGILVGISREGEVIPIVRDKLGSLYWIGRKGESFNGILDLPAGNCSFYGKEYFIFRHNENVYVEEIK